jgi:oleandomycin transport system ATP-binding protein
MRGRHGKNDPAMAPRRGGPDYRRRISPGEAGQVTDAIRAEGLIKNFGKTKALAGVDLAAATGTVLGVLGPNGAGKTTAVRILTTLLLPDSGRATVGGYDVVTDAHRVRQLIGLTGQYASVDDGLTGTNNLVMIGRLLGLGRVEARARASELLSRFELTDAAARPVKTYSGGMRRRIDLAASLVGHPQVLFLDEPTTGLDPQARSDVWDMVRVLVSDGVTVLLTTQYLDEADQLADDIVVIDHGRVIATGTPDELKAKVGGQVLEVVPADLGRIGDVAAILASWTGGEPVAGPGVRQVTAQVPTAAVLPGIVRQLDENGIELAEFSLRKSSLNEVFLTLTGHRAEDLGDVQATEIRTNDDRERASR